MIEPTEKDVGRSVVYHDGTGDYEQGTLVGFNDKFAFVRYGLGATAAATLREDLTWLGGRSTA